MGGRDVALVRLSREPFRGKRVLRCRRSDGDVPAAGRSHLNAADDAERSIYAAVISAVGVLSRGGQSVPGEAAATGEDLLAAFCAAVHSVLTRHSVDAHDVAMLGYEAGIAGGFYGDDSAIAAGLKDRLADYSEINERPILDLMRIGRFHGQLIRRIAVQIGTPS